MRSFRVSGPIQAFSYEISLGVFSAVSSCCWGRDYWAAEGVTGVVRVADDYCDFLFIGLDYDLKRLGLFSSEFSLFSTKFSSVLFFL